MYRIYLEKWIPAAAGMTPLIRPATIMVILNEVKDLVTG
jgi:hypothetical protein